MAELAIIQLEVTITPAPNIAVGEMIALGSITVLSFIPFSIYIFLSLILTAGSPVAITTSKLPLV